jgi:hypothetical protein
LIFSGKVIILYDTFADPNIPIEHRGETLALKSLRRGAIFGLEDA